MIIVISDSHLFEGEVNIINQLFDEGLGIFHLRKYENTEEELYDFLKQVKPQYLNKIVLHQHHRLAKEFGIKRFHFSTESRKKRTGFELNTLNYNGNILSTSVHSVEEYNTIPPCFAYVFISPVFDSISKKDYKAKLFDLEQMRSHHTKLIALGGINSENCTRVFKMGFDGLALLGSIWRSEDKINTYKEIHLKCSTSARS
jgi:thiamine-phosphate pyrophosphorylase